MSARNGSRLALLGWAACLVLAVGAIVFYGLSSSVEPIREFGARQTHVGLLALAFLAYATVGALVVFRRPENRIGWLLLLVALGMEIEVLVTEYAAYALVAQPGALPGGEIAAWLAWWIWVPSLVLATTFLFLLFPNGRLLSRRWVAVVVLAAVAGTLGTVTGALSPGPVDFLEAVDIENPFGVARADDVATLTGWLFLPVVAISAVSLLLRYRRSRGEERLQLKWFVATAVLLATTFRHGDGGGRGSRSRSRWPFLSTGSLSTGSTKSI